MSLAAKSGQMQVFNNLHTQNLNQGGPRLEGIGHQLKHTGSTNMKLSAPLPPHPASSSVSHKPANSLNPNAVIGGLSTQSAISGTHIATHSSQLQVSNQPLPGSAQSKQSSASAQQ